MLKQTAQQHSTHNAQSNEIVLSEEGLLVKSTLPRPPFYIEVVHVRILVYPPLIINPPMT